VEPVQLNDRDYTHRTLARALGGDYAGWMGDLLRLIGKAGPYDRARLRLAYPVEVTAAEWWGLMDPPPTYEEIRAAIPEILEMTGSDQSTWDRWECVTTSMG